MIRYYLGIKSNINGVIYTIYIGEMSKNILVLGGGGFIGGHLAKRLKSEGNWVRVADIKEEPSFFKRRYM